MTVITKLGGFEAFQIVPSLMVGSGSTYPENQRFTISLGENFTLSVSRGTVVAEVCVLKMQQLSVQNVTLRRLYLDTRQAVSNSYQGLGSEVPYQIESQIQKITNSAVLSRKIHFWLATLGLPVGLAFDEYKSLIEGSENVLRKRLWTNVRKDDVSVEFTGSQKFVALSKIVSLSKEVFVANSHVILRAEVFDEQLNLFVMAAGMYTEYRLKVM